MVKFLYLPVSIMCLKQPYEVVKVLSALKGLRCGVEGLGFRV